MPNPAEFDLGYLFKAYPGHFLFGYNKNLFPNEAYRRRFLRVYLQEYYRLNDLNTETDEFETELEDLFHKANLISILQLIKGTWLGMFFDFNKDVRFQRIRLVFNRFLKSCPLRFQMFQNKEIAKEREKDQYFCGGLPFSLRVMLRFFGWIGCAN